MVRINLTAIIITVLVIGALFFAFYIYQGQSSAQTVSATGNAHMQVEPDEAVVYLLVETRDASSEKASSENAEVSLKVLNSLRALEIEDSDIQTENYNIYPEYDWSEGDQKIKGYVASNSIKVKTNNFNGIGKMVDVTTAVGALVSSINFELSTEESNKYKAQALEQASEDAKIKAEAIASGLGKELGALVQVSSSDYNYMPYPLYARAEMASASDSGAEIAVVKKAATDIQPKDLEITATVSVMYKIK